MRKKNQKRNSFDVLGVPDSAESGSSAAPTPGELRIPGDLFVKRSIKNFG